MPTKVRGPVRVPIRFSNGSSIMLIKTRPPSFLGLALIPLLLGLTFFAASLTPSLIPRGWLIQGVLGGAVMGLGFMIGQFCRTLWAAAGLPRVYGARAVRVQLVLAALVGAGVITALLKNEEWQDGIRVRLDMAPTEDVHTLALLGVAMGVFTITVTIGYAVQWIFDRLRTRLYRLIAERTANIVAVIAVVMLVLFILNRGIIGPLFEVVDDIYETAQNLAEPEAEAPTEDWRVGSAESLVDWQSMGKPGRDFVRSGPDAEAISAFTGRDALDPLRVYVGRAQDDDPERRAAIALQELLRVNAFDREVLIIASPTGTGWLDAGSHDVVEHLLDGDVATVAVQYSHLQSPIALIFETEAGLDQAEATVRAVYDHWKSLPSADRPRLYIHGLSLGAWSSMHAVNIFRILNDPIDGALWAGPPFPSALWKQINANRNPDSSYVRPTIDDGNLIRYASQYGGLADQSASWGDMRIVFLQYASDPIVFFEAESAFRTPIWMEEPAAPDVYPRLTFTPFVTQLQLALDMAFATSVPMGFGHNYEADDYIDAWLAVTGVAGWSDEDIARLKAICGGDWGLGCQM